MGRFCCQNPDCADSGRRGHGNLTVCARYGKHQRRLLYCKTCKARFSERKGTPRAEALANSAVSERVRTAYVERLNGTDRNRNARKGRKTYCFSKDGEVHEAVTYFTGCRYNFCWPVRTLREADRQHDYQQRTPAMAAGLTDHMWTLREWLSLPGVQRE